MHVVQTNSVRMVFDNARPLTRPARFSQASQGAAASRESARGSAGAVTLICMRPATARRDGWDAGLSTYRTLVRIYERALEFIFPAPFSFRR